MEEEIKFNIVYNISFVSITFLANGIINIVIDTLKIN